MKPNTKILNKLVQRIFKELKSQNIVQFKEVEEKVQARALDILLADFDREKKLDEEVHKMLDDLENQSSETFQRSKMFQLLKKKLAHQRGIVL